MVGSNKVRLDSSDQVREVWIKRGPWQTLEQRDPMYMKEWVAIVHLGPSETWSS
jgi:hypothetical protein